MYNFSTDTEAFNFNMGPIDSFDVFHSFDFLTSFKDNLSNIHSSCCIKIIMQRAEAWAFGFKHTLMGIFRISERLHS